MVTLSSWKKEQGLSVPALAERLGVSKGAVMKWLAGDRIPRRAMCHKIVTVTEGRVRLADLWGAGFGEPPEPPAAPPPEPATPPGAAPAPGRDGPLDQSGERV